MGGKVSGSGKGNGTFGLEVRNLEVALGRKEAREGGASTETARERSLELARQYAKAQPFLPQQSIFAPGPKSFLPWLAPYAALDPSPFSIQADATLVTILVNQGYSIAERPLKALAPRPGQAVFVLSTKGTWVELSPRHALRDGSLLAVGPVSQNPFDIPTLYHLDFRFSLYRYSVGAKGDAVFFSLNHNRYTKSPEAVEVAWARRLGRTPNQIKKQPAFQELQMGSWSAPDLITLLDLLTLTRDPNKPKQLDASRLVSLDSNLHEIAHYQRMARVRGWGYEQTRKFLFRFIENQGGVASFGDHFAQRLNDGLKVLERNNFSPEESTFLLLELAKYDPSLKSWVELERLLDETASIASQAIWAPIVSTEVDPTTEIMGGSKAAGSLGTEVTRPEIFQEGLNLSIARLSDILIALAKREGLATSDAYPHFVNGLRGETGSDLMENVAAIESFLNKTTLAMARIGDWVKLTNAQREQFIASMDYFDQLTEMWGMFRNFRLEPETLLDFIIRNEPVPDYLQMMHEARRPRDEVP